MAGTHGTRTAYVRGCRCPDCAEANRVYHVALRARLERRGLAASDPRHGTLTAYANWGCRCVPCKTAMAAKNHRRFT